MPNTEKYENILDALQKLLQSKDIKMITVSEIAQAAGIGKGSLYYYFPSKEAVLEALIARTYEKPMEIATTLADQKEISSFTRMAMIFQACRNASLEFSKQKDSSSAGIYEGAYIHQMFLNHVITGLKGTLAQIIRQGIQEGQITFEDPDMDTFLGLPMAMDAARKEGSMPTVFNAANELAVKKFLQEKIGFLDIYDIIAQSMERHTVIRNPELEEILAVEDETYKWIESRW